MSLGYDVKILDAFNIGALYLTASTSPDLFHTTMPINSELIDQNCGRWVQVVEGLPLNVGLVKGIWSACSKNLSGGGIKLLTF